MIRFFFKTMYSNDFFIIKTEASSISCKDFFLSRKQIETHFAHTMKFYNENASQAQHLIACLFLVLAVLDNLLSHQLLENLLFMLLCSAANQNPRIYADMNSLHVTTITQNTSKTCTTMFKNCQNLNCFHINIR